MCLAFFAERGGQLSNTLHDDLKVLDGLNTEIKESILTD